jgi:hypothetical protein
MSGFNARKIKCLIARAQSNKDHNPEPPAHSHDLVEQFHQAQTEVPD